MVFDETDVDCDVIVLAIKPDESTIFHKMKVMQNDIYSHAQLHIINLSMLD